MINDTKKEEDCPECRGSGYYVGTTAGHGCDGTESSCNMNCPVPIPVQEPCNMCQGEGKISADFKETLQQISQPTPVLEDPNEIPF